MSLVSCPECRAEVSDRASACPSCGFPLGSISSAIEVYGYTQMFAKNPRVKVLWNGTEVGTVGKGELLQFPIEGAGELMFKAHFRKASVRVPLGGVTKIKLSWDRITGKLIPQVVDVVTPGQ